MDTWYVLLRFLFRIWYNIKLIIYFKKQIEIFYFTSVIFSKNCKFFKAKIEIQISYFFIRCLELICDIVLYKTVWMQTFKYLPRNESVTIGMSRIQTSWEGCKTVNKFRLNLRELIAFIPQIYEISSYCLIFLYQGINIRLVQSIHFRFRRQTRTFKYRDINRTWTFALWALCTY